MWERAAWLAMLAGWAAAGGETGSLGTMSADEVMARVRANVAAYSLQLPSLFCDERFLSQRFKDGHLDETHVTVSTFRVRRATGGSARREERMVREVDGVPAHGDRVKGPYTLNGGFDAALGVLTNPAGCFAFSLQADAAAGEMRLRFQTKQGMLAGCGAAEAGRSGELVINRETMQVLQIRQVVPHPPGGGETWGPMTWTVQFRPVRLGEQTFSTPFSVETEILRRGSTERMKSIAQYSGYHKLEVRAKVLPETTEQP